jgi:hypothetical protein
MRKVRLDFATISVTTAVIPQQECLGAVSKEDLKRERAALHRS